jgi:chitinase
LGPPELPPSPPSPVECPEGQELKDTNGNEIPNKCEPINRPPIADAGSAQTFEVDNNSSMAECEETIELDGSDSSDPDDDPLSYSWEQTAGEEVTLDDASSATLSFTPPPVYRDTLRFELTVDDGRGETDTDETSVSILCEARG